MKLAIVGSRSITETPYNQQMIFTMITYNVNIEKITEIVSGGADGVDTMGENIAKELNIPITIFYPDWNKHGLNAGFKRNTQIIKYCDFLIAFQNNKSIGTQDSIGKIKKLNKPHIVIDWKY